MARSTSARDNSTRATVCTCPRKRLRTRLRCQARRASPTACPAHVRRRAGAPFNRLGGRFPTGVRHVSDGFIESPSLFFCAHVCAHRIPVTRFFLFAHEFAHMFVHIESPSLCFFAHMFAHIESPSLLLHVWPTPRAARAQGTAQRVPPSEPNRAVPSI